MGSSWQSLWKYLVGVAACLVLGAIAFLREQPVPLLEQVNLGIHEAGHLVAILLPPAAMAAMGSIAQVAVPLLIAAYFLAHGERLGAGLCLAWAGTSARDVSVYIADAPYERLQLIGGEHDWARVLGPAHCDCLERAGDLAGIVHGAGFVLVLLGVLACALGPLRAAPRQPAAGV
ncbi:MAG: hypothetical protein QOK40_3261 [Miltoncostaeaceae bacterium]|jgi:hypothetical protein|nr:hypothetical protein [Miltoncostaeaceae bacterium]